MGRERRISRGVGEAQKRGEDRRAQGELYKEEEEGGGVQAGFRWVKVWFFSVPFGFTSKRRERGREKKREREKKEKGKKKKKKKKVRTSEQEGERREEVD